MFVLSFCLPKVWQFLLLKKNKKNNRLITAQMKPTSEAS